MRRIKVSVLVLVVLLTGCEHISYYAQAVKGQFQILAARQDVEKLIKSDKTDARLKQRLILVRHARKFAQETLQLDASHSFSHYVDVKRDYVVWNVVAADEFSLKPLEWCFPIAGCVSYRGYFEKEQAIKKERDLKQQGYDVHVGGIQAYSTLGWFNDPLLNTFLFEDDLHLVGLIFHELAHQKIYVPGDTAFNESFATAVELMGLNLWINHHTHKNSINDLMREKNKESALNQFLQGYYDELAVIYQEKTITDEEKRVLKKQRFTAIYRDYLDLKKNLSWDDSYDQWMSTMNNAKLATLSDYNGYVDKFFQIKNECKTFDEFYSFVDNLSKLSKPERIKAINDMVELY